jgi:hypothetical protein
VGNAKVEQDHIRRAERRYRESRRALAAADAASFWFAGAAVFAFLVAGIIVYRVAEPDLRSASRPMSVASTSSSAEQPPIYAHVEGVDP